MGKYDDLAERIVEKVGGRENIESLTHCITRLRFSLKDEGIAKTKELKTMQGVVTVMQSGGQYQVVIGNHVAEVYQAVVKAAGIAEATSEKEKGEKKSGSFIDIISGIFAPTLGVLGATGMIKGFNALFLFLGWLHEDSGTYQILQVIGDSFFYFFPIMLGYTSAVKFEANKFVGMTIGAAMVHPGISAIMETGGLYTILEGTVFESVVYTDFLRIPVILTNYASSVIPVILSVWLASKLEAFFKKIVPDVIKLFVVPLLTLLVTVPVTFLMIGPAATWLSNLIGLATNLIYGFSPLLAGLFVGGFWQVFVIFGIHWGLIPIAINNLATQGYDAILAMSFAASFAQIGVVLAMWIRTKDKGLKAMTIPAFISGLFGVTEPAIYGVTLPRKKPFIVSCIAAGVGGGIIGFLQAGGYLIGGLGIFGFTNFINPVNGSFVGMWQAMFASAVAFALAFVIELIFYREEGEIPREEAAGRKVKNGKEADSGSTAGSTGKGAKAKRQGNVKVYSPLTGKVIPLTQVKDQVFASGAMGDGVAIVPTEGKLYAPASGKITTFFPTGHALGITTEEGAEVLVHIGMDTVELKGKYFYAHAVQNEVVSKGKLLVEFNIEKIKEAGYDITTPVVITNTDAYEQVDSVQKEKVRTGDEFMWMTEKRKDENDE